jgi:pyruvate-formate lyase-activating enzyme
MNDKLCVLPFTHLATHPNGNVSLCCVSDHVNCASHAKFTDGRFQNLLSLNNNSLDEIFNCDLFKKTRLEMLEGKEPYPCRRCYEEESKGIMSKRVRENAQYLDSAQDIIAKTKEDGTLTPEFTFIELRLGNICNLKCRTCNPVSSSKWVVEYKKLNEDLTFVTDYSKVGTGVWFEDDAFWEELAKHSSRLETVYVNGGEPTMVEKHFNFLYRLIDLGLNKQVKLWYSINLTNLPERLLDLWKQFKAVDVYVSIDDLKERNEYIRTGSKWDEVLNNLNELRKTEFNLSICQTVSIYNIFYIDEFFNYMKDIPIHINWCYDPDFLQPWILPQNVKDIILEKINNCEYMAPNNKDNIRETLKKPSDEKLLQQFKEYNNKLDEYRQTKFADVFPELAKLI